jgi:hypothetical protein
MAVRLKFPRVCSPCPPQLAAESIGTVDLPPIRTPVTMILIVQGMLERTLHDVAAIAH